MNILFSSNDNYVRHLGVSLYSLLSNNQTEQKINCFVIDNEIKPENLNNLKQIVNSFTNADLFIIPFSKFKDKLKLDMPWPVSLSCYARLFVSELLPSEIDRVLYLDCDTVITSSLSELWNKAKAYTQLNVVFHLTLREEKCQSQSRPNSYGLLPKSSLRVCHSHILH